MDFTQESCHDFVKKLASKDPIPGGGGAAALVGSIGTALGNMVGSLTIGKKKYASVEEDIVKLKEKANNLENDLLTLVRRDAEVFEPLSRAYGLKSSTDEEKVYKAKVMEEALKEACSVPLEIMEKCCEAIKLHEEFAQKGAKLVISDVGCGVICCKAALKAASLNVFINTKSMQDREYAKRINDKANNLLNEYSFLADKIYSIVEEQVR